MADYEKNQNTNWYRAGDRYSFTADPSQADPGEVERVGLHSCVGRVCEEKHWWNDEWYSVWLLKKLYDSGAYIPESGHRAEVL